MPGRDRTASLVTLGCKVNQYETQLMRESLRRNGYRIVAQDDVADVYVINTCTVTGISDRKSRQLIRRAVALNSDATIVVTGCYVERKPDEIKAMHGVDLVLPNRDKPFIGEILNSDRDQSCMNPPLQKALSSAEEKVLERWHNINAFDDQTRAMVKIQDGCDSFCTYCIVPYVRGGTIHSRPIQSIVQEVRSLAAYGHGEMVLTGIHLGAYGRDMIDGTKLHHVLRAIHDIDGVERIRLSSIEPMDISDDLISEIACLPKCANHFHISLQSGSDRILNLMRRGYTTSDFKNMVDRIRTAIPGAGISTDIMVGFPGETEQDFSDTCDFIELVQFSRLHVFRFSPRSGTPAAKFPDRVQDSVASRRSQEVRKLGDRLAREFCSRMLGQKAAVLVEHTREGKDRLLAGFTSNYIRTLLPDAPEELTGQIICVKLIDVEDGYMVGLRAS